MLGEARQTQTTALDRFYKNLAYKPWCGDDKTGRLVRPKSSASQKLYIAPNQPAMIHWLVFDIDHENCLIWKDENLPPPNLMVQNPSNSRSHLYYAIAPVCVSENARKEPVYFMEAVMRGIAQALQSDDAYTSRIAKNPLCKYWRTTEIHGNEYTLGELADYVDPISRTYKPPQDEDYYGRNVTLFNRLRHWAYGALGDYKGVTVEATWGEAVLSQALNLGTIEIDFNYNEIKNTAKSVAKWVWKHYTVNHKNKGTMNLKALDIPLKAKQRLAARRTHELRSNATEARIRAAIKDLAQDNALPSKSAVARRVGLSRQQISRRYRHLFDFPIQEAHTNDRKCHLWCTSDNSPGREFSSVQREPYMRDNKKSASGATSLPLVEGLDRAAGEAKGEQGVAKYLSDRSDKGD